MVGRDSGAGVGLRAFGTALAGATLTIAGARRIGASAGLRIASGGIVARAEVQTPQRAAGEALGDTRLAAQAGTVTDLGVIDSVVATDGQRTAVYLASDAVLITFTAEITTAGTDRVDTAKIAVLVTAQVGAPY
jgi:hypothetical protein